MRGKQTCNSKKFEGDLEKQKKNKEWEKQKKKWKRKERGQMKDNNSVPLNKLKFIYKNIVIPMCMSVCVCVYICINRMYQTHLYY